MADIQDLITQAAQSLGTSEDQAKDATSGVLGFLQDKVDGGDFQSLLSAVPGASDLVSGSTGGGGLGGIAKLAESAFGGKLGGAVGLLGALQKSGLDASKIDDFVGMFAGFLKNNVDGDLIKRLVGQVPELQKLVG